MPSDKHLSQDAFFDRLDELFSSRKGSDHGHIFLSQKRLVSLNDAPTLESDGSFSDLQPGQPLPIVIRATDGKSKRDRASKVKFSTIVQPDDLESFYTRYADSCKAGMAALKPRDRSKKKAKAKKKKAAS